VDLVVQRCFAEVVKEVALFLKGGERGRVIGVLELRVIPDMALKAGIQVTVTATDVADVEDFVGPGVAKRIRAGPDSRGT
jgi:hypothetical protein